VESQVHDWKVLEEESLSLHRYIKLFIGTRRRDNSKLSHSGWAFRKLDREKLVEALKQEVNLNNHDAEEARDQTIRWLTKGCDTSMPKAGKQKRRPVPWWNADIAVQRKRC